MYEITLEDDTLTWTTPELEIPLSIDQSRKSTDVEVLSNDIYTDVFPFKRTGSHTWANMSKDDYDTLFGFYYRQQHVLYKYPRITITALGINSMIAKIDVGQMNIVDHCGNVQNITFAFRESKQNPAS